MKTIVHMIAALMFVLGSAGFAEADGHACDEHAAEVIECETVQGDFGHDAGEHGGTVHCGSAALCAFAPPSITEGALRGVFELASVQIDFLNEDPTDLQPPRS